MFIRRRVVCRRAGSYEPRTRSRAASLALQGRLAPPLGPPPVRGRLAPRPPACRARSSSSPTARCGRSAAPAAGLLAAAASATSRRLWEPASSADLVVVRILIRLNKRHRRSGRVSFQQAALSLGVIEVMNFPERRRHTCLSGVLIRFSNWLCGRPGHSSLSMSWVSQGGVSAIACRLSCFASVGCFAAQSVLRAIKRHSRSWVFPNCTELSGTAARV